MFFAKKCKNIADGRARGKFRQGVAGEIGLVFAGNSGGIRVGRKIWGRGPDRAREVTAWEKLCVEKKIGMGGFRVERIPLGRESRVGRGAVWGESGVEKSHSG